MRLKDEFDNLVAEHLDGTATQNQTSRLDQIMKQNPKYRDEYRTQVMIHQLLLERLSTPGAGDALALALSAPAPERTIFQKIVYWVKRLFRRNSCPCCRL